MIPIDIPSPAHELCKLISQQQLGPISVGSNWVQFPYCESVMYLSPFRLTAFAYGSTLETTLGGIYTRVRNRRVLATLTGVAAPARRGSRANNMPVSAGSEHEASCTSRCNAVVYCCRTAVRGAATGRYEASSPLTLVSWYPKL